MKKNLNYKYCPFMCVNELFSSPTKRLLSKFIPTIHFYGWQTFCWIYYWGEKGNGWWMNEILCLFCWGSQVCIIYNCIMHVKPNKKTVVQVNPHNTFLWVTDLLLNWLLRWKGKWMVNEWETGKPITGFLLLWQFYCFSPWSQKILYHMIT